VCICIRFTLDAHETYTGRTKVRGIFIVKNDTKVIAIDHGNRNIKTQNYVFPSSYMECGHLPNMGGDVITYKG